MSAGISRGVTMPYDSTHTGADAFSLEITPTAAAKIQAFDEILPPATRVYITNLPGTNRTEAMALCRRLREDGMRPVPHLAARGLRSRADLSDWLNRAVTEGGAREILLVAGSNDRPAGPFRDTLDVLDSGLLESVGLSGFGVAGHPEGHPQATPQALVGAAQRKQAFATASGLDCWIVSQFAFSARPVLTWAAALEEAGVALPVRVGLPGPAKPSTLITYARQCGVGPSLRVLTRRPDVMTGLLRAWTPDGIVADLAAARQREGAGRIVGVHLFPFGGVAKAAAWVMSHLADPPSASLGLAPSVRAEA